MSSLRQVAQQPVEGKPMDLTAGNQPGAYPNCIPNITGMWESLLNESSFLQCWRFTDFFFNRCLAVSRHLLVWRPMILHSTGWYWLNIQGKLRTGHNLTTKINLTIKFRLFIRNLTPFKLGSAPWNGWKIREFGFLHAFLVVESSAVHKKYSNSSK